MKSTGILVASCLMSLSLSACVPFEDELSNTRITSSPSMEGPRLSDVQQLTITKYFQAYKNKDVGAILTLFDEDILGALYPDSVFGVGIEAARPGIEGDYAARPEAYAVMPDRYHIAPDKWMTYGQSIDGDTRAPLWILFDFNETGDKIEATYTQIGWPEMVAGASVDKPTRMMRGRFKLLFERLAEADFAGASRHFADNAALYQFPPANITDYGPVITGASDVASVLAFKWGEGAWRANVTPRQYMQFVFVGIPGVNAGESDRVALFTFNADPASPSYEKIIRVDVMGPSGG